MKLLLGLTLFFTINLSATRAQPTEIGLVNIEGLLKFYQPASDYISIIDSLKSDAKITLSELRVETQAQYNNYLLKEQTLSQKIWKKMAEYNVLSHISIILKNLFKLILKKGIEF